MGWTHDGQNKRREITEKTFWDKENKEVAENEGDKQTDERTKRRTERQTPIQTGLNALRLHSSQGRG